MAAEPRMRRRPPSAGKPNTAGPSSTSPVANVMNNRDTGDAQAVIAAVFSELVARADALRKELGLWEMKPWGEFFARFKAPRAWKLDALDERLTTNFLDYRANYSVIVAGFVVIGIVLNVTVLLALVLCALLLTFLFPAGEGGRVVRVGERVLENSERVAAAVIGIACILVLSGAWYVMLFYGGTGVFICLAHAVFRPRSLRGKASRLAEEVKAGGGFTIEGAQNFFERTLGMRGSPSSQ